MPYYFNIEKSDFKWEGNVNDLIVENKRLDSMLLFKDKKYMTLFLEIMI
jgi:hypothetical protein